MCAASARIGYLVALVAGVAVGAASASDRAEQAAKRPMTVNDILTTSRIVECQISPSGEWVAYTVKRASTASNSDIYTVYTSVTSEAGASVSIHEGRAVSNLRWTPDSRSISFVATESGKAQVWRMDRSGGTLERVTDVPTGVSRFEWSPDGSAIAFLTTIPMVPEERTALENDGFVFAEPMSGYDLLSKGWASGSQELRLFDVATNRMSVLWRTSRDRGVVEFHWSPVGGQLALMVVRPPGSSADDGPYNYDLGIMTVASAPTIRWFQTSGYIRAIRWSPRGDRLAMVRVHSRMVEALSILSVADGRSDVVLPNGYGDTIFSMPGWTRDGQGVLIEAWEPRKTTRGLYRVDIAHRSVEPIASADVHRSLCTVSREGTVAACVHETLARPSEIEAIDIAANSVSVLTRLHPEYDGLALGSVTELRLISRFGSPFSAFLIKPVGYREGVRYPLLIGLYRFTGEFFLDQYGNYPFQAFAAAGHAVLLVSIETPAYPYGDHDAARRSEIEEPFADIEAAADAAIEMGVADRARLGIMGWSRGSFLTRYTIAQTDRFKVASAGDSGIYDPSAFWLTSLPNRLHYTGVVGADPLGRERHRWDDVSPALQAHRIRTPLLIELTDRVVEGLEFFRALKDAGGDVELVIYPDGVHVFNNGSKVSHRLRSMQRNLDWFNYWLLGRIDPDPAKAAQYQRWKAMRGAPSATTPQFEHN